jgi:hypothetical protein
MTEYIDRISSERISRKILKYQPSRKGVWENLKV